MSGPSSYCGQTVLNELSGRKRGWLELIIPSGLGAELTNIHGAVRSSPSFVLIVVGVVVRTARNKRRAVADGSGWKTINKHSSARDPRVPFSSGRGTVCV